MKQLLQSIRSGEIELREVPPPQVRPTGLLIRTRASVISPGTERMVLDFAQKSLWGKARSRPDLVKQVIDKARRDGFVVAARAALSRLDQPAAPGYACAGTVVAVGPDASSTFAPGDAVACAGTGYATHAEINYVPRNLAVHIPRRRSGEPIGFDEAAFAPLGAIALHAARLGGAQVGDRVAVIGLGLIGLLAGQILRASGCQVVGIEPQASRRALAGSVDLESVALHEAVTRVLATSDGHGADLVIIAATLDSQPAQLAARLARDRARVVVVGATGLELPRREYYQKELQLIVARSYGPGRYDRHFEEQGLDYPRGYVRWTERENMRAFLELIADDRVRVAPLVTDRVPIDFGPTAYELLHDSRSLAIVLEYQGEATPETQPIVQVSDAAPPMAERLGVSVVGAGTFASSVLLPALRSLEDVQLRGVASQGGTTARVAADRFGFQVCASSAAPLLQDRDTHAVIIATRHDRVVTF
jgi:threonine dehydrogenase-like Zn-dependent dehydrogenase